MEIINGLLLNSFFLSKLPGVFAIFAPLTDIMPVIPVLFFYWHLCGKQVLVLDNFIY